MANICGGIVWFLILITVAFPIAGICAFFYILVYCFAQICSGCQSFSDILEKGMQLPGYAVTKIKNCEF
ncbi:hypothetical protein GWI33_009813 [Rhynchophorus ferrugineus]|uniref:Uncharacterized protein n=1 Tax=Rhynchophorus ferrugineus TaxID=354439 RepID=A0A834MMG4_RHYFE|nr:hypothetical protein GWI33_009813 [Rhynchophorus ferrugineus]